MIDLLTLQALCTLLMCDDPSNLTPDARERIEKWANEESHKMGFDGWIDAYHWTPVAITPFRQPTPTQQPHNNNTTHTHTHEITQHTSKA